MTLFWAILFVVLVIAELCTLQLISIWFAVGAFLAMVASYYDCSILTQSIIFVVSSGVLFAVTFPFIRKFANSKKIATNSELNLGKNAVVIEEINRENGTGRVKLEGVDWSAVADEVIEKGTKVIVKQIDGTKLKVAKCVNSEQNIISK